MAHSFPRVSFTAAATLFSACGLFDFAEPQLAAQQGGASGSVLDHNNAGSHVGVGTGGQPSGRTDGGLARTMNGGNDGGEAGAGGAVGMSSGVPSFGGAPSQGGASSLGGAPSQGGAPSHGGAPSLGGESLQGGAPSQGGVPSFGGASSQGGALSQGGVPSLGGASSQGGALSQGGVPSLGGASSQGGSSPQGGSFPEGGAVWAASGAGGEGCRGTLAFPNTSKVTGNVDDHFDRSAVGSAYVEAKAGTTPLYSIVDQRLVVRAGLDDALYFSGKQERAQAAYVKLLDYGSTLDAVWLFLKAENTASTGFAIAVKWSPDSAGSPSLAIAVKDTSAWRDIKSLPEPLSRGQEFGGRVFLNGCVEVFVDRVFKFNADLTNEVAEAQYQRQFSYIGLGQSIVGNGPAEPLVLDDFGGGTLP